MKKYHLQNQPDREITSKTEIKKILTNGKFAVISMCRDNEPYTVSLSYGFDADKNTLYFHCAPQGLKIDFIQANPRVCATIIEDGGYVMDKCGHNYKTAVFWGEMKVVEELDEMKHGMQVLLNHLEEKPSIIKKNMLASDALYNKKMKMLKLEIGQIHAKQRNQ